MRILICYDSLTDYYGVSYAADDEFERRVLDSITEEDLRNFNPNADLDLARQRAEIGDFFMEAFRHYGSR